MTAGLWVRRGGLPAPLSTLVGRVTETDEVAALLDRSRLVTVTGPGGVGKSRLALAVAQLLGPQFPDGVWWVSLADLTDPADLLTAVADAVAGLVPDTGPAGLLDALCDTEALLVWDDGEQLGDAVADLVGELLAGCPGLRMLATGRRSLGVPGEVSWALPPLAGPPEPGPGVDVIACDAVRLFVDRARSVQPRFAVTDDNLAAIVEVCHRLDGLPLAIELAAARVAVLSVPQIAERLADALPLLVGNRMSAPRHRSLRASVDRSYTLLGAAERELFAELSVFAGGFDLEAVEAMCRPERAGQALDVLAELVDRSLVTVEPDGPRVRYRLLEPIRQYAAARLHERAAEVMSVPQPQEMVVATTDVTTTVVATTAALRIQALGAARVYRGETLLDAQAWTYAKPRELLYFLLSRADATKEQIGAALWPWVSPGTLRNSFHTTLHHLRRALGDPTWITYRHGRYAFDRDRSYGWDVEVLESGLARVGSTEPAALDTLAAAADAYQGDFLADLPGEQWIDARRAELRTAYEQVLIALGRGYARTGRFAEAVRTFERAIAHDNLLEVAHRELIRCYADMGERPRALRHYTHLVALLRDQLGIPPSTETRELHAELRTGRDAPDAASRSSHP